MFNTLETKLVGNGKRKQSLFYWSDKPDMVFDSKGEVYFSLWVSELMELGYIDSVEFQPEPFVLSSPIKRTYTKHLKTKEKEVEQHLESGQIYTADVLICWNKKAYDDNLVIEFNSDIKKEDYHLLGFDGSTYIELKPDGMNCKFYDRDNMIRIFKSKQKVVYDKFDIYINLVFHNKFFRDTFVPERYLLGDKTTQKRLIKYKVKTLEEFVNSIKQ